MRKKLLFLFLIPLFFIILITRAYSKQSSYNPQAAIDYANFWWNERNSIDSGECDRYRDFDSIGGDCANFVSQCLIAGGLDLNGPKWSCGCFSTCTLLHAYLKNYPGVILETRFKGEKEPEWFVAGDPAIFGYADGHPRTHAVFAVTGDSTRYATFNAHSPNRKNQTIPEFYQEFPSYDRCTFYHIPTIIDFSMLSEKVEFATTLIIDKSGSMSGEKIQRVKDAAYGYIDVCRTDQDLVSIVAFASSAQSICGPISIEQGRATLKSDILSVSAGGSTNIGSGLDVAYSHLSSSNAKNKVAVLMSDGQHNTGTYEPETKKFVNANWPIYTVAFGQGADQSTLSWIAQQTGGLFFPSDVEDIVSIYNKIHTIAHSGSIMYCYNDFIKPGQTLSYKVPVDPDMRTIGFFTNWQGSRIETTLISPGGRQLSRLNFNQWGRLKEEQTYTFFEMDNPEPGDWEVRIVGYDLPRGGEQINFHSFCKSDIFSNILGFQPRYRKRQEVKVEVKLAEVIDDNLVPLRGAKVRAEIKRPSTSLKNIVRRKISNFNNLGEIHTNDLFEIAKEISKLTRKNKLYDNGSHGDKVPGDGIYSNTYSENTINGPYIVTVDFQGSTSKGKTVARTLQQSFQVGPIEQNPFTVSEFLYLLAQKTIGNETQLPKKIDEKKTKNIIDSVFDTFKKR